VGSNHCRFTATNSGIRLVVVEVARPRVNIHEPGLPVIRLIPFGPIVFPKILWSCVEVGLLGAPNNFCIIIPVEETLHFLLYFIATSCSASDIVIIHLLLVWRRSIGVIKRFEYLGWTSVIG